MWFAFFYEFRGFGYLLWNFVFSDILFEIAIAIYMCSIEKNKQTSANKHMYNKKGTQGLKDKRGFGLSNRITNQQAYVCVSVAERLGSSA